MNNKFKLVYFKSVRLHELSSFVRQLATMSLAGVPLYQAITTIYEAMDKSALKTIVFNMKEKIKSGTAFSQCLEEYPSVFPPLMVGLVKIGEVTGMLENALVKYADLLEWEEEFKSKIVTMLIYPALMVTVSLCVLIFILIFIFPKFVALFSEYNQSLPLPTLILIFASRFFANFWWLIILVIIALMAFCSAYLKTRTGRENVDKALLKFPLIGSAVHKSLLARFSFALGVMAGSGVPLLQALSVTGDTIGNTVLSGYLRTVARNVERGDSLSKSLMEFPFFPKSVIQMIRVGEETGKLEDVLSKVAVSYEREMEVVTRRIVILFEPAVILLIAVFIGFVAIAILLPILSISTVIK